MQRTLALLFGALLGLLLVVPAVHAGEEEYLSNKIFSNSSMRTGASFFSFMALDKRQACSSTDTVCTPEEGGGCCAASNPICCVNGCCDTGEACCGANNCFPQDGSTCCADGGYCLPGNVCGTYQGSGVCCVDETCHALVLLSGGTTTLSAGDYATPFATIAATGPVATQTSVPTSIAATPTPSTSTRTTARTSSSSDVFATGSTGAGTTAAGTSSAGGATVTVTRTTSARTSSSSSGSAVGGSSNWGNRVQVPAGIVGAVAGVVAAAL